jgi:hypothetical protein
MNKERVLAWVIFLGTIGARPNLFCMESVAVAASMQALTKMVGESSGAQQPQQKQGSVFCCSLCMDIFTKVCQLDDHICNAHVQTSCAKQEPLSLTTLTTYRPSEVQARQLCAIRYAEQHHVSVAEAEISLLLAEQSAQSHAWGPYAKTFPMRCHQNIVWMIMREALKNKGIRKNVGMILSAKIKQYEKCVSDGMWKLLQKKKLN